MVTRKGAIALMFLCTLFTSIAQVLYKLGVRELDFNLLSILGNGYLILGIFLYIVGAFIMIIALKGGELSSLYPIIATSYIWVSLFSFYFFGDSINLLRWMGIFVIIIGVFFVSIGSKERGILEYTDVI